jgi:hypothetical protein
LVLRRLAELYCRGPSDSPHRRVVHVMLGSPPRRRGCAGGHSGPSGNGRSDQTRRPVQIEYWWAGPGLLVSPRRSPVGSRPGRSCPY